MWLAIAIPPWTLPPTLFVRPLRKHTSRLSRLTLAPRHANPRVVADGDEFNGDHVSAAAVSDGKGSSIGDKGYLGL